MADAEKKDKSSPSDTIYNASHVHELPSREKEDSSESSWPGFHENGIQAWTTVPGGWLMMFSTFGYLLGISGTVVFSVGVFMLSLAQPHQYYQIFLSQGLGLGIALGLTYLPTTAVLAHHFQRRRTLAMGILVSGGSFGGLVHPIFLNKLFHGATGFALEVRISAGLNLGLMVISLLLMRTRLSPKPAEALRLAIRRFVQDPPYVLALVGSTLIFMGLYYPIILLQLYAIKHGIGKKLAVLNGSNGIGRILPYWAARHVREYQSRGSATFICGGLIFVLLAVHDAPGVVIFAIFDGFFSAFYISLLAPMQVQLSDNFSEIGVWMGVCYTFIGVGDFIGTPIPGAFLTSRYIWWRPTVFAGVVIVVGALLLNFSGMLLARKWQAINNT